MIRVMAFSGSKADFQAWLASWSPPTGTCDHCLREFDEEALAVCGECGNVDCDDCRDAHGRCHTDHDGDDADRWEDER